MRGISDVIALPPGRPAWWIECKNNNIGGKGRKGYLSPAQKHFRDMVERVGNVHITAYTLDDVTEELRVRGLLDQKNDD